MFLAKEIFQSFAGFKKIRRSYTNIPKQLFYFTYKQTNMETIIKNTISALLCVLTVTSFLVLLTRPGMTNAELSFIIGTMCASGILIVLINKQ